MITKEDIKQLEEFVESLEPEGNGKPRTKFLGTPSPDAACVDQVLATIKERGKIYGDPALSHHNIGLTWTGLIQQHYGIRLDHPLPAWLVELMMVAFKVHRSARVFHADNYVDAKAYLKFAEEDQEKGIV
jgi:hypothetical protein